MAERKNRKKKMGAALMTAALALTLSLAVPAIRAIAAPAAPGQSAAGDSSAVTGTAPETSGQEPSVSAEPEPPAAERPAPQPPSVPPEEPTQPQENAPSVPADDAAFDDTVFIGDSRTEGFHLYSGMENGQYLYAVGATVASVADKATQSVDGKKIPILDALETLKFSKVYIMLGMNELGWPRASAYYTQYGKVIDRVREINPDAVIVLETLPPVSAKQEGKHSYVNNSRIAEFNDQIRSLAEERCCQLLDVAPALTGADGCLPEDLSADGIHLTSKGYALWRTYLEEHPV